MLLRLIKAKQPIGNNAKPPLRRAIHSSSLNFILPMSGTPATLPHTGFCGVERIVQMGKLLCRGSGLHSKQVVTFPSIGVT